MAKQEKPKPGAEENGLVVKIQNDDIAVPQTRADVPATIELFKKQLALLRGESSEKISIDIDYNGENIKDVQEVSKLMEISASIHARAAAFETETKRYKLEGKLKPFTQSGKTVSAWEKIIEKAKDELINGKQIKKLEDAIKRLNNHLSENQRLKNDLEELMNLAAEKLD